MAGRFFKRVRRAALCAGLAMLVLTAAGGAATRVGVGKMTVMPNRVPAGSTNDFTFGFLADTGAVRGTTLVDVPRGWSKPQRTSPTAPGYFELQALSCPGTRISGISGRRIVIATKCAKGHSFKLVYHRGVAPQISADGFVFLTQTRPANAPRKTRFKPLGPRKQAVVRVRGAAVTFMLPSEDVGNAAHMLHCAPAGQDPEREGDIHTRHAASDDGFERWQIVGVDDTPDSLDSDLRRRLEPEDAVGLLGPVVVVSN